MASNLGNRIAVLPNAKITNFCILVVSSDPSNMPLPMCLQKIPNLLFNIQAFLQTLPCKIFITLFARVQYWNSASQQWFTAEGWFVFSFWWWRLSDNGDWKVKENVANYTWNLNNSCWNSEIVSHSLCRDRSKHSSPTTQQKYSRPLNNTGLNSQGPFICRFVLNKYIGKVDICNIWKNILFSLSYFFVRTQNVIHVTYKVH